MTDNVIERKPASLGRRIRQARGDSGHSITKIAVELGVDPRTVARWQSDDTVPSVVRLTALARLLGKPVSYFVDEQEVAA
jgi:transcriptional regulator with XRE-family HTH domain